MESPVKKEKPRQLRLYQPETKIFRKAPHTGDSAAPERGVFPGSKQENREGDYHGSDNTA